MMRLLCFAALICEAAVLLLCIASDMACRGVAHCGICYIMHRATSCGLLWLVFPSASHGM
jgi:hypothetical protein